MTAFVQCGAAGVVAALVAWQLGALLTTLEAESRRVEATAGAMAFAFAVAVGLCAASLPPPAAYTARVIVPAGALVLIAGLWRDLDRGFRYLAGLALIGAAALVVAGGGIQIDQVKIPLLSGASPFWKLGAAGPPLTVAFIVGVAVVVRATDPMPGLTAGLGFLSALTFMLVALTRGRDSLAAVSDLSAPLAAVIAGACCGLVTPGLGPRALSLGRGGAGLLGFLLGVLAVIGTLKHTAFLVLGLPLLALAVPLLNLLYMQRQWVQAGQQDPADLGRARSLVDMLQRRGFTHRRTVGVLLGLQAYCCLVALALVVLITLPVILKALLLATLLPAACAAFFLISRIAARVAAVEAGKVEILGVSIDAVTYESTLDRVAGYIAAGGGHHIFTADVSGIMRAREDPELAEVIRTSDLVTADGAGVLWAARLYDFPLPERVSGCDLVRRLSGLAAAQGYRVFLLGAAPGVAEAAAEVLRRENPGVIICGVQDGYFADEAAVAEQVRLARPDLLFVALGIPRQERFIRRWYQTLDIPVCMGVGGSFDVISGRLERAPGWMQRSGLEWLFRVYQEPKRWRRLLVLPRFVGLIAVASLRAWWRGQS